MSDYFIQKIIIKDVRDIKNLEIPLDDNERKHLIITGKNGSGKTSTLIEINNLLNRFINNSLGVIEKNTKEIDLVFSNQSKIYENIVSRKFILAYFKAKRENKPSVSTAIQNINLTPNYTTDTDRNSLHTKFIQYMVKLRVDMLDSKEENELDEVKRIETWFKNFEHSLQELFGTDELKLKYYRKELNFKIEYNGKSFGLNELSDGYSSLLAILTELILRMEAHDVDAYDMQGVVLVDEIETHLHVALQKKVLPFLTSFFPNIQFIVTTHSPFVLSSLSNAVICDLEKRLVTEDLSGYSYDSLIESYFDIDKYSKEVKEKIEIFEKLSDKNSLTDNEKDVYYKLKKYFNSLPTFMSDELAVKLNEIKLRNMFKAG
jgi:predicted ATP-binding protein involved in virulence